MLPTLTTERLQLRWLTPGDAPSLYAIFGDPLVCRYWSRPSLTTLAEAVALQEEIARDCADGSLFQWGIADRASDHVIGTCTLASLSQEHRRAEVGFALARAVWGHGYATEVLAALIAHAFTTLDLHRLEADVDPRNAPSIRVLEKACFQREGYLRERYTVAGEVQDAILYGLLRTEWQGRALARP